MKKIRLMLGGLLLVLAGTLQAQIAFTGTASSPPPWGPSNGVGIRYYYIPDIRTYYDVTTGNYFYISKGKWIQSADLPHKYRKYDLYKGHKVLLKDYHGETPYADYKEDRKNYPKGYFIGEPQRNFGDKSDWHPVYMPAYRHSPEQLFNNI